MILPTTTLALLALVAAQTQKVSPPPPPPPSNITFHSDVLHLDYTYPKSFQTMATAADAAVKEERDKATGATKAAMGCITLPLIAADSASGIRMVLIMRMDGDCLGATISDLGAVATSGLTESLKRFGDPQVGKPSDYKVAGRAASTIFGTVKSETYGATFYGATSCLTQGKDIVCWELLSSDCTQLPDLMNYPVRFDGETAEPVIPTSFAPACKP
jgi:hypothetical protein